MRKIINILNIVILLGGTPIPILAMQDLETIQVRNKRNADEENDDGVIEEPRVLASKSKSPKSTISKIVMPKPKLKPISLGIEKGDSSGGSSPSGSRSSFSFRITTTF